MSNQISLTIPNDDPIALRAFGNALEEMAVAHGAVVREPVIIRQTHEVSVETVMQGIAEPLTPSPRTAQALREADDIEAAHSREFTDTDTDDDDTQLATNDTLDADGLPWDARIHSGNQERNADNTWRVRRRPKDVTPEQWAEQVAQIRDELFALMAIPVADPVVTETDECPGDSTCTDQGCPHHYADTESPAAVFGAPEPVEVPPVAVDVPPIADPVPPAPPIADPVPPAPEPLPPTPLPPVAAADGVPATLAELMTWLTKKAPSDDAVRAARLEQINGIVARHGLVTLGQLQKRLDLIPQVYADLVKELGQ